MTVVLCVGDVYGPGGPIGLWGGPRLLVGITDSLGLSDVQSDEARPLGAR